MNGWRAARDDGKTLPNPTAVGRPLRGNSVFDFFPRSLFQLLNLVSDRPFF